MYATLSDISENIALLSKGASCVSNYGDCRGGIDGNRDYSWEYSVTEKGAKAYTTIYLHAIYDIVRIKFVPGTDVQGTAVTQTEISVKLSDGNTVNTTLSYNVHIMQ